MTIANSDPRRGVGSGVKIVTVSRGTVPASMPAEVVARPVGSHPGGGLTLQSGCPAGSAFQNMILSKKMVWVSARQSR